MVGRRDCSATLLPQDGCFDWASSGQPGMLANRPFTASWIDATLHEPSLYLRQSAGGGTSARVVRRVWHGGVAGGVQSRAETTQPGAARSGEWRRVSRSMRARPRGGDLSASDLVRPRAGRRRPPNCPRDNSWRPDPARPLDSRGKTEPSRLKRVSAATPRPHNRPRARCPNRGIRHTPRGVTRGATRDGPQQERLRLAVPQVCWTISPGAVRLVAADY